MAYTELKEELEKILKADFNNRQSLQEVRRDVFLNSESNKQQQNAIAEKESKLLELRSSVVAIENEVNSKASEVEQLRALLKGQREDAESKENGLLDLINLLKSQLTNLTTENEKIATLKNEANNLSIQNADYTSKIRELIFHIDAQNTTQENLEKEIVELKNLAKNTESDKQQRLFHLSETAVKDQAIATLNGALESTKSKIVLLESQIVTATSLIASQNKTIEGLEAKTVDLKLQLGTVIKDYSFENELLIRDNGELISDIDLLRLENEGLKLNETDFLSKQNVLKKISSQIRIKDTLITSLINEKSILLGLIDELKPNSSIFSEQKSVIDSLNLELSNVTTKLEETINSSKLNLEALEFEKSNLNFALTDLQNQVKDLEGNQKGIENADNELFIDKLFKQIDILNNEKQLAETDNDDAKTCLAELKLKYEGLSQVIENQKNEIIGLEDRNKQIKLATILEVSGKDKTGMKLKINELVREIDKCIALLSV